MVGWFFFCAVCWTEFWLPTAVRGLLPFGGIWLVKRFIDVFKMGRPSCGSKWVYSSMFSHFESSVSNAFLPEHWSRSGSVSTWWIELVMKPFSTSSMKLSQVVKYLWAGISSVEGISYPSAIWYLFSFCVRALGGDNFCRFRFCKFEFASIKNRPNRFRHIFRFVCGAM